MHRLVDSVLSVPLLGRSHNAMNMGPLQVQTALSCAGSVHGSFPARFAAQLSTDLQSRREASR